MNAIAIISRCVPLLLLAVWCITHTGPVHAQTQGWSEEFRLIQSASFNERVSMPSIAADGDNVYVVYRQGTIRMIRSTDRGKTWSDPVEIAPDLVGNSAPTITLVNDRVLVVWPTLVEVDGLTAYQLVSTESRDGGATWSPAQQITSSRDDTFVPRLIPFGDRAILLWLETPLAETLGSLSLQQRLSLSPDSVDMLQENIMNAGGVEASMRRLQATIYTSIYNPATSSFADGGAVESFSAQRLPTIFLLYGPIDGNYYITFNQNTNIKSYESSDGQNWQQHFEDREYFDTRQMFDLVARENERVSVWIERSFSALPVMLRESEDADSVQLSPPHNVRAVPKLTLSDGDMHVIWEAGQEESSWITYMRTDDIPPTATILSPTTPEITDREVVVQWDGEDNISSDARLSYAWRFGNQDWSPLQSENVASFPAPPNGEYVFQLRTEDWAGNVQNPVSEYTFNTFQSAPATTLLSPPPALTPINSRSVTINFRMEDNNDDQSELLYSARADDSEWTAFAQGNSHTFTNLSNGQHTLSIRSRDTNNNVEEEFASCTVTISVGLDLQLTTVPEEYTNAETLTIAWEASDDQGNAASLETYYYQLNDSDPVEIDSESVELTGLDQLPYTFTVWGMDSSGDTTPKVETAFVVDRTPPETTARFTETYQAGFPVIALGAEDPPLADGSSTPVPTRYEYQIGEGQWTAFTQAGTNWPVERPLAFYEWGYTILIRAIDDAGNADPNPAVVDLTLFSRSNPYILYPVLLVIAALILVPIYLFFPRDLFARRSSKSTLSTTSSFDSEDDSSDSLYSFGDDDEDKK